MSYTVFGKGFGFWNTIPIRRRTSTAETTGNRTGLLVEFNLTSKIFANPIDKRTEDYISGRFG